MAELSFGEKLLVARKQLDLYSYQMAELLGVHPNSITKYERGEAKPHAAVVRMFDLLCEKHTIRFDEFETGSATAAKGDKMKIVLAEKVSPATLAVFEAEPGWEVLTHDKLPDGLAPDDVAPHADAGLTAYHAVAKVAHLMPPGSTTVIMGIGGVGHIAVQLARELGSAKVLAIDTQAERLSLARELGADETVGGGSGAVDDVRDLTGGHGADLVIDFVGTDDTHRDSLAMLARNGTYSVVGYGGTVSAPSNALVGQEQAVVANLVGSWTDLYELIQLHAAGRLTLRVQKHPLDEVNDVLDSLRAGEILGRAVLLP